MHGYWRSLNHFWILIALGERTSPVKPFLLRQLYSAFAPTTTLQKNLHLDASFLKHGTIVNPRGRFKMIPGGNNALNSSSKIFANNCEERAPSLIPPCEPSSNESRQFYHSGTSALRCESTRPHRNIAHSSRHGKDAELTTRRKKILKTDENNDDMV
jgi:hypothetical protein